ncbi:MAG: prepilin peptidase [Planctomycetota bacterium]|nr:prepilin peptidase [Planctomycetota bacterium]
MAHVIWISFLFLLGACVGSFLNVVIYRLPRGQSIAFPPSHCPLCGRKIKWYDNIPIVSWLRLRGRCRWCKGAISPRYPLIELLTALLVSGLYVCYFVLRLRDGIGSFFEDWPMFVAHAALLCGLLAASAVDIELFIVPLQVMWVCSAVGIAASTFRPQGFLPSASPALSAASVGAVVGLLGALVMLRLGWIQRSFLDAADKPVREERENGVAITAKDGVNPRKEILREILFLTPAIVLSVAAYLISTKIPVAKGLVDRVFGGPLPEGGAGGKVSAHLASGMASVFGLLIGIAWIWGARIFGTLGFGKEAMGMGDVHILAAVGAVAGWKVATLVFFVSPIFGLAWALHLFIARGKRELPYGPWLALGTLVVLLFYDAFIVFVDRFAEIVAA